LLKFVYQGLVLSFENIKSAFIDLLLLFAEAELRRKCFAILIARSFPQKEGSLLAAFCN